MTLTTAGRRRRCRTRSTRPTSRRAAPVVNATGTTLVAGSTSYSAVARSSARRPRYATTRDYDVAAGAMFTAQDVKKHRRVVVLGPTVVANLFAGQDPVGQTVRIDGTELRGRRRDQAQGVQRRPGPGRRRHRADHRRAGRASAATARSATITVQGRSAATLDAAQAEVTSILEQRHHVTDTDQPGLPGHQPGLGARGVRRRAPRSSPRCSARSPRSRCSSAGSA